MFGAKTKNQDRRDFLGSTSLGLFFNQLQAQDHDPDILQLLQDFQCDDPITVSSVDSILASPSPFPWDDSTDLERPQLATQYSSEGQASPYAHLDCSSLGQCSKASPADSSAVQTTLVPQQISPLVLSSPFALSAAGASNFSSHDQPHHPLTVDSRSAQHLTADQLTRQLSSWPGTTSTATGRLKSPRVLFDVLSSAGSLGTCAESLQRFVFTAGPMCADAAVAERTTAAPADNIGSPGSSNSSSSGGASRGPARRLQPPKLLPPSMLLPDGKASGLGVLSSMLHADAGSAAVNPSAAPLYQLPGQQAAADRYMTAQYRSALQPVLDPVDSPGLAATASLQYNTPLLTPMHGYANSGRVVDRQHSSLQQLMMADSSMGPQGDSAVPASTAPARAYLMTAIATAAAAAGVADRDSATAAPKPPMSDQVMLGASALAAPAAPADAAAVTAPAADPGRQAAGVAGSAGASAGPLDSAAAVRHGASGSPAAGTAAAVSAPAAQRKAQGRPGPVAAAGSQSAIVNQAGSQEQGVRDGRKRKHAASTKDGHEMLTAKLREKVCATIGTESVSRQTDIMHMLLIYRATLECATVWECHQLPCLTLCVPTYQLRQTHKQCCTPYIAPGGSATPDPPCCCFLLSCCRSLPSLTATCRRLASWQSCLVPCQPCSST